MTAPATGAYHLASRLSTLRMYGTVALAPRLTPDGRFLLLATDSTLAFCVPRTGECQDQFFCFRDQFPASPDGKWAAIPFGKEVRLRNRLTDQQLLLASRMRPIQLCVFSPDSHRLLVADGNGNFEIWDPAARRLLKEIAGHAASVDDAVFSPDGDLLATGGSNDTVVKLWDWAAGRCLRTFLVGPELRHLEFVDEGQSIICLTAGQDALQLWDVNTGQELRREQSLAVQDILDVRCAADGSVVALYGSGALVRVSAGEMDEAPVRVEGKVASRHRFSSDPLMSRSWLDGYPRVDRGCLSQDGQLAVTGDARRGILTLWDVATRSRLRDLQGTALGMQAVCISAHGSRVAAGFIDGRLAAWDVATGQLGWTTQGHEDEVLSPYLSTTCAVAAGRPCHSLRTCGSLQNVVKRSQ